jgi:predicted nucleic acid-binding protein
VRLHARELTGSHGSAARDLLAPVSWLELSPIVLARALEPFPLPLRTLDALHLASIDYLRDQRIDIRLATDDERMARAARRLRIPLVRL